MGEFAAAAGRLAGYAGLLFGWRPAEFWAATPAELGAVIAASGGRADEALSGTSLEALRAMFPDEEGLGHG